MKPAAPGRGLARLATTTFALVLIIATFLALAWGSVAVQLQWRALRGIAAFSEADHALRWDLRSQPSIVLPGSIGLEAAQFDRESGLSWRQESNDTDISLRLPRPSLALDALQSALLSLRSDGPLKLRLWATDATGTTHPGAEATHPGGHNARFELALPRRQEPTFAHALRLHVDGAPGTHIELRRLDLHPSARTPPDVCQARDSAAATLAHCGPGLRLVHVHGFDVPEHLLDFRDELEAGSLAYTYPVGFSTWAHVLVAARQSRLVSALPLLALPAALVLVFIRRRTSGAGDEDVSPWPLLLLAGPAALLWLGVPGEDDDPGLKAFACLLCLPLLFTRIRRPWAWIGNGAAWKASAVVTSAALGLLGMFALLNANDADGFVARLPDLDKLWIYPAWALLQQFLLIEFIAPRTRRATGSERGGAILAGTLFGLLHLPNFFLMLLTFLAATIWSHLGYRYRALLPLVVSHALLGLLAVLLSPSWLLRSAEVGGRFLMAP